MDLSATIHLLGDLLGQVISELESPAVFEVEERIRQASKERRAGDPAAAKRLTTEVAALSPAAGRAIASAFAVYFDLINLAEEAYRVGLLRQGERQSSPAPLPETIAEAVASLHAQGVSQAEMAALLERLSIELVLTAHPTEAKRRTILSKLQRIAAALAELERPGLLPVESAAARAALHAEIIAFWLTDRSRASRPTVTDEVRTGLYFVDEIFWQLLPRLYAALDEALARHYPALAAPPRWLRLASWIGGDRDGNPYVTADTTAETLRLHRGLAIEKHRAALQELARRLSISDRRIPPPADLQAWIERRRPFPAHAAYIEQRYAREPYRLALSLLAADLGEASHDDMTARLLSTAPHTARIHLSALVEPLEIIARALPAPLAADALRAVRRQVEVFGLHAARLDIREDAARLNAALEETLRALGIAAPGCDPVSEAAQRLEEISRLLGQPVPGLARHPGVTRPTAETWALFQLIARVQQVYGVELLGPFIVSMTHSPADLLTVLLLARWAGCADGLPIVPLFETIEDLAAAPQILEALFTQEAYRTHLESCRSEQMVMIGYSDSNKDGGYLSANWALYQAQENIAAVCQKHAVKLTLFHGRGGTTARGGGPANRAIRAQPPGSINGRFRLTEQGEIITSRYANPALGFRHLEQIVNAVLLASSPARRNGAIPGAWRAALEQMSFAAQRAYRALVRETPGFLDFWAAATPLAEIRRLTIGSRPAARQAGSESVEKIRAIPWVFSWMQSRFNLPGWYGLGAGLSSGPSLDLLREMYTTWPFFSALLDNAEMSLLKADMDIAALYAGLAPDQDSAGRIFAAIRSEYERTCERVLAITGHSELMDAEPALQHSVRLREPYIDPLNYLQVEMLRRLRALPDAESAEAEALREVIVITINGIAAGLRNTG